MLTTAWGPVGTRGGCGVGWGPCACPGGNAIQWGLRGATRSHPNEDKHKASSSTPPRPLSLQDPGPQAPQWIGLPDSVVNIHQGWTLLVVRRVEVFGGVLVLGRIAAAHMPAFETEAQVYPDPTSMWGRWPLDPHN